MYFAHAIPLRGGRAPLICTLPVYQVSKLGLREARWPWGTVERSHGDIIYFCRLSFRDSHALRGHIGAASFLTLELASRLLHRWVNGGSEMLMPCLRSLS